MRRKLALALVLLVLALGLGLRLAGVEITPESLALQVRAAGEAAWGPLVFVALYMVFTAVGVPAMLFHIAGGVIWGFWPGLLYNVALANLTNNLHFGAGRLFGSGPLQALLQRRGLDHLFDRSRTEGPWLMVAARQLPLPAVAVNLAAGISAMPWWHFVVGSGVGGLVPQAIWTWFAAEVFHDPHNVRSDIVLKALAAGAIALLFAVGSRWLGTRFRAKS